MYELFAVRHSWPEQNEISIMHSQDIPAYAFLHLYDSVDLLLNGQLITTDPHACILFTPSSNCRCTSTATILYDWFFFSTDEPLPDDLPCDTLFYPADYKSITGIIGEMEREFYARKMYRDIIIDLKLQELLIKLSRASESHIPTSIDHQTRLVFQNFRNELLSNLAEPINLTHWAQKTYLSMSRFHSIYRTLFGKTPKEDLLATRMHTAAYELLSTDKSVSAIAEMVGFNNTAYFSRQFQQCFGVSPTAYRKAGGAAPKNGSPR